MNESLPVAVRRPCRMLLLGFATAVLTGASVATAAPCAGFTDVDSADPFCPSVEWIRNRSVTLGCTSSTEFCPAGVVNRLAMAAFMNRLGTALTPVQLRVDASVGSVVLDANPVVCQTSDFPVIDFPRRAYVDLCFPRRPQAT